MSIAGRALIVGNTDGIGLALTRRLLGSGWTVVGLSRRASALETPGYHHGVADVSAVEYRPGLQKLQASQGPFDVCVYCAGVGEFLDLDNLAGETHIFRVNLIGAVETAAVVLPPMIAAGRGHFIGLSSIGDGVSTEAPSYAASKAGLSSYLEGLALALRPRGVRVHEPATRFRRNEDGEIARSSVHGHSRSRRRHHLALFPSTPGPDDVPKAHGRACLAAESFYVNEALVQRAALTAAKITP